MLSIISNQPGIVSFLSIREISRLKVSRAAKECFKWLKKESFHSLLQIQRGRISVEKLDEKECETVFMAAAELDDLYTLSFLSQREISETIRSKALVKAASNGYHLAISIILDSHTVPFSRFSYSVDKALERKSYSTVNAILVGISRRHFLFALICINAGGHAKQLKFLLSLSKQIDQSSIDMVARDAIHYGHLDCYQAITRAKRLPQFPKVPGFLENDIWKATSLFLRDSFPNNPFSYLVCGHFSKTLFMILAAKFNGAFREGTFFIKIGEKEGALRLRQGITEYFGNHYFLEFDSSLIFDPTWKQFVFLPKDQEGGADMTVPHNLYLRKEFPDIMIGRNDEMQGLLADFADLLQPLNKVKASLTRDQQDFWKDARDDTRFLRGMFLGDKEWYEDSWEDIRRITDAHDLTFTTFIERIFGPPIC